MAPAPPFIAAKYHGGGQSAINRIVIHGTVSPTVPGGALAVARFFQNPPGQTSAHYVVDPDSEYQCVYDHVIAWHDGTNTNSIGVELCDPVDGPAGRWQDGPHQVMLVRAAALVRDLCNTYGVPMVKLSPADIRAGRRGLCGHVDMRDAFPGSTTHYDPGPDFPWAQFVSLVAGSAPTPTPIAASAPQEDAMRLDAGDNRKITLPVAGRSPYLWLMNGYGAKLFVHQVTPVRRTDDADGNYGLHGYTEPAGKPWEWDADKPGPYFLGDDRIAAVTVRYSTTDPDWYAYVG